MTDPDTTEPEATDPTAGDQMIPLSITAHLQQGIVLDTLFGTALDGLLASLVRDRAKAAATLATGTLITGSLLDGGLHATQPATIDLPLARCTRAGTNTWHWMCTTAHPQTPEGRLADGDPDVHHQHCRARERIIDHTVARIPASIPPASGRFRMRRMPIVSTPATAVTWQAVGNPNALHDLLDAIPAIGRRRGTGEGTVLAWDITAHPDADPNIHGHCHHDHTLGRPVPLACAQHLSLPVDRTGTAGLRPPYWHPATQHHVVLPTPLQGAAHATPA